MPKNLFSKKLYCVCCDRGMQKSRTRDKESDDYYIACKMVNKIGRFCDNRKVVKKVSIEINDLEKKEVK